MSISDSYKQSLTIVGCASHLNKHAEDFEPPNAVTHYDCNEDCRYMYFNRKSRDTLLV